MSCKYIVIVDDQREILDVVCSMLEERGYPLFGTENPTLALEFADDHEVTLLLTDIVMPEMSGLELAKRLLAKQPTVKILAMTGYNPHAICYPVLHKPFRMSDMLRQIQTLLDA